MDVVGFAFGAILALVGLCALFAALIHPAPSKTRIIRLLSWPGIGANDRIALPLALLITCMGATFICTSFPGAAPLWISVPFLIVGVISAVQVGLRRGEV